MIKKIAKAIRKFKDPGSHGSKRSPEWEKIRNEHLKAHPSCEACGSITKCEVHHVEPFHLHPEKELDPTNLITLCRDKRDDHLYVGHCGSFKFENTNVVKDAEYIKEMLERVKKENKE